MDAQISRALLLIQQERYDLAEKSARRALHEAPESGLAHSVLALALGGQDRSDEALREAREGVRLDPELDFAHYVVSLTHLARQEPKLALVAIREANRLDPEDPQYYAVLGEIHLELDQGNHALTAADEGLALDPEHGRCLRCRSLALTRLGRHEDATQAVRSALAKNPEDAELHRVQGVVDLHAKRYDAALDHFREALRLDPTTDLARSGIVEALKARYLVYSIMLQYFLWMSRLGAKARWGFIIGLYFLGRVLRVVAKEFPQLAPFMWPVIIVYVLFVYLTWTAVPLFDLLLRLNRDGRLALNREQIVASNVIGLLLLAVMISAGFAVFVTANALVALTLVLALAVIPVSSAFRAPPGWPRMMAYGFAGFVIALGAAGAAMIGLDSSPVGADHPQSPTRKWASVFIVSSCLGSIAASWLSPVFNGIAGYLLRRLRPKRRKYR
jgi:tetratricopeptide (TPR) repeat protein